MSRKAERVRYDLDPKDVRNLSPEELRAVLRGADELIGQGGRSLLVKILKGSRTQDLLRIHLDRCPVYGYFRHLPAEQILASANPKYLPVLEAWQQIDYKKVRQRIQQVMRTLQAVER